jgi:hypothetical protein
MNTINRKALPAWLEGTAKGFTAVVTAETIGRRPASEATAEVRGASAVGVFVGCAAGVRVVTSVG